MQYAALIYTNEATDPKAGTPEADEIFARYWAFTNEITESGVNKGGEALHASDTATTLRFRDGSLQVTDGPFAETKEQLGGFYLIEAEDLDQAIAIAAKIPAVEHGSVELRPVWDFSQNE
jgi:hypothetical protein